MTADAVGNGYRKYRGHLSSQKTKTSADSRIQEATAAIADFGAELNTRKTKIVKPGE